MKKNFTGGILIGIILGIIFSTIIIFSGMTKIYPVKSPPPKLEVRREIVTVVKPDLSLCPKVTEAPVAVITPILNPTPNPIIAPARKVAGLSIIPEKILEKAVGRDDSTWPPPQFSKSVSDPILFPAGGEVHISWTKIPKANRYIVFLRRGSNHLMMKWQTTNTFFDLKDLPYLKYKEVTDLEISLATENRHGKVGPESKPRLIQVRRPFNIRAPAIQEIKIEE